MASESGSINFDFNAENPEDHLQDLTDEQLEQLLNDTLLVTELSYYQRVNAIYACCWLVGPPSLQNSFFFKYYSFSILFVFTHDKYEILGFSAHWHL